MCFVLAKVKIAAMFLLYIYMKKVVAVWDDEFIVCDFKCEMKVEKVFTSVLNVFSFPFFTVYIIIFIVKGMNDKS